MTAVARAGRTAVRRVRSFPVKVREAGAAYTVYRSLQLIAPRVFRLDRFTVYTRFIGSASPPRVRAGVRWATQDDFGQLASLQPVRVVEDCLARGDRACVVVRDGELIAYIWCSFGAYEDIGLRFELAPDEVWLHDGKVAHAHRGRGHFPRLMRNAYADLAAEGITRTLLTIDDFNRNSRRVFSDSFPLGRFLVFRIGRLSIFRARRGREVRWGRFRTSFEVPRELYGPSGVAMEGNP